MDRRFQLADTVGFHSQDWPSLRGVVTKVTDHGYVVVWQSGQVGAFYHGDPHVRLWSLGGNQTAAGTGA